MAYTSMKTRPKGPFVTSLGTKLRPIWCPIGFQKGGFFGFLQMKGQVHSSHLIKCKALFNKKVCQIISGQLNIFVDFLANKSLLT